MLIRMRVLLVQLLVLMIRTMVLMTQIIVQRIRTIVQRIQTIVRRIQKIVRRIQTMVQRMVARIQMIFHIMLQTIFIYICDFLSSYFVVGVATSSGIARILDVHHITKTDYFLRIHLFFPELSLDWSTTSCIEIQIM
ncbi:hypothetical protein RF11_14306 [Thelohanellus kitauei]|uniref:Uncharacterized protein n=1 Tax=Thelohanellus kitauei TaxID=669202 RepID=A0A0C2N119_THEKT|nr:hypothetical protein RF11_14306 [Thelohanellus kitauei]